jgi:DNA-binding MarR family transcriptional regulator
MSASVEYPVGYASANAPLFEWARQNGRPIADPSWPQPEDRGLAHLSSLGEVEYVEDIVRPGRIIVVAAEEGTGKSYAIAGELAIRLAVAGGSFAGTWPVLDVGPVLVLSEMHADDEFAREDVILDTLELQRTQLVGGLYRLPIMTAAGTEPALKSDEWRAWITGWLRDMHALAMIVDTATAASNVDPWGPDIQAVYRGLRAMLEAYPQLAIILVVHLKKPQGRGERRLSDVLGEWGRWCDVILLMENDGASLERVKLSVRKRVRRERRIIATKRDGLLVDPEEVQAAGPKVPMADVVAIIAAEPGISQKQLAARLEVAEGTARTYVKTAEQAGQVRRERRPEGPGYALFVTEAGGEGVQRGATSVLHPSSTPLQAGRATGGGAGVQQLYIAAPPPVAPPADESEEELLALLDAEPGR